MQSDKIIWKAESLTNKMLNEINKNKSITQKDLKNKSEKKTLIKGQLKIWFDMRLVAGHHFSFSKTTWVYRLFWYVFLLNINYKCKSKSLSKHLIIISVNK